MLHFPRWKVLAILAVVLAGVVFALPNFLPKPWQDSVREYAGLRPMTRGFDIQGGSSLLVELDRKDLVKLSRNDALPLRVVHANAADQPKGLET